MKLRKNTIALAAAACSLLGVNASEAAVTLTFAQAGANVTATWSGSYSVDASRPQTIWNDSTVGYGFASGYGAYGVRGEWH